jgi:hypothetical protein
VRTAKPSAEKLFWLRSRSVKLRLSLTARATLSIDSSSTAHPLRDTWERDRAGSGKRRPTRSCERESRWCPSRFCVSGCVAVVVYLAE